MRFLRISVTRFGPLRELDTGELPLPGLNVVLGPNEAGKTSFFLALRALIHGVYPASRDTNPWAPWDGGTLEIEADVETRSGDRYSVHRRLLASPWGRLTRNGDAENLGNSALPDAAHLSRRIYEHVYAITLPQLVALQEGDEWKKVRDRLVAGMAGGNLAAPREVAEELEGEAHRLWRSTNRGNFRDREIRDALGDLSERLRAARDRDREVRAVVREAAETRDRIEEVRGERARLEEYVGRAREYRPLERRLEALERLRAEGGPAEPLASLPRDPLARLTELEEAAEGCEARLSRAVAELRDARRGRPARDPLLEGLAGSLDPLRRLVSVRPVAEERRKRLDAAENEIARVDEAIRAEGTRLLTEEGAAELSDPDGPGEALRQVPLGEFRRRLRLRDQAAALRHSAEESLRAHRHRPAPDPPDENMPRWGILGVAGGLTLMAVAVALTLVDGFGTIGMVAGGLGLVLLLLGALRLREWDGARRAARREIARIDREEQGLRDRVEEVRDLETERGVEALSLLDELPLRPERTRTPDESLAGEIEALRSLLDRRTAAKRIADEAEAAAEAVRMELTTFLDALPQGVAEPLELPSDPVRALVGLESVIPRIEAHLDAVRAADEAEARLEEARTREEEQTGEARRALEALREDLTTAAPAAPGPEAAAREVHRRMEALAEASRIEREITGEFGSVENVRDTLADLAADPDFGDRALSELEERLRGLSEEESDLRETLGRLETRERQLLEGETPDRIEEEMVRLREEQSRIREERDRLWVLARLVRAAERDFREAHQPALIRRAETFLRRITGGRYSGLILGDEADPDVLGLRGSHLPDLTPVKEPISTGTREQVFLSLRLAILSLLEGEGEPLPLMLDEAIVNWDPVRRGLGLDLLAEVAKERQVFLFTCHEKLAREVQSRSGRILELPALE